MVFLQFAVRVGRAHATFQALRDGRATLCISAELIAEVRDVLSRPSITAKFPALTPQRLAQFLDEINLLATNFDPIPGAFTWPRPPR
jgi:predicted nucleic acid-binding protein